jgi:hypothetical protein
MNEAPLLKREPGPVQGIDWIRLSGLVKAVRDLRCL